MYELHDPDDDEDQCDEPQDESHVSRATQGVGGSHPRVATLFSVARLESQFVDMKETQEARRWARLEHRIHARRFGMGGRSGAGARTDRHPVRSGQRAVQPQASATTSARRHSSTASMPKGHEDPYSVEAIL